MVRLLPLSAPVVAGLVATTRMRSWLPAGAPLGITVLMLPLAVVVFRAPIWVGVALKKPLTSDSCTRSWLPAFSVPLVTW